MQSRYSPPTTGSRFPLVSLTIDAVTSISLTAVGIQARSNGSWAVYMDVATLGVWLQFGCASICGHSAVVFDIGAELNRDRGIGQISIG